MTLQSSGKITIGDIKQEFIKMINPDIPKLTDYYGIVVGIPTSGLIKLSDFYGKSARISKIISATAVNVNTDNLFTEEERNSGAELEITINSNVYIGSFKSNKPSLTIGNNNKSPKIILNNNGNIYGAGGESSIPYGGTALKILAQNTEINNQGNIYGGGGIGGAGGNGGNGGQSMTFSPTGNMEGPLLTNESPFYYIEITENNTKAKVVWNTESLVRTSVDAITTGQSIDATGFYDATYYVGNKSSFLIDRYYVSRQPMTYVFDSGGTGGAGGGIVPGRGYTTLGNSLSYNAGKSGSVGTGSAGMGGNGGNSGDGGDWGSSGKNGSYGTSGSRGKFIPYRFDSTNTLVLGKDGQSGQSGGAGGYAVHLATLPNDEIRNITWTKRGNVLGSITKSVSTDRT